MNYREAIDWLFSTQWFGIKLGLEAPKQLLTEFLANPPATTKVIHVAGTNGKGSTCSFIERIARNCGRKTGLFTSPHLIDYRERIQVSGVCIPEAECANLLTELRSICETLDPHPTFFEISLVLAMKWFCLQECELIILETGMGGRLDATTAVPADVCVITPIGLDHTQFLGETLEAIALEKAGIMVPEKPLITCPQAPEALRVLQKEANRLRCPLTQVSAPLEGYHLSLPGTHQKWNAALAVSAAFEAGLPINTDILRSALSQVTWPGRFEKIQNQFILDGAHNPHSAQALAETWRQSYPPHSATLVFSAVAAKDIQGILHHLAPLARTIHLCPVSTPRALPAAELALALPPDCPTPTLHASVAEALAAAQLEDGPILVAGSLFLIGEARAILTGVPFQACTQ